MIGFSEGFHDAAVAVVNDGKICYATHSERYSKIKHDKHLDITAASTACLLYTSPSPRDGLLSRMPSSA